MFFIVSKLLVYLVYPLPLLLLILLGIVLFYKRRGARLALLAVIVCFYGLSIPYTANHLMDWLEMPRRARDDLQPHYEVVIVLSGMVDLQQSQDNYLEFNSSVDRIWAGIALIKQGRGDVLLISGGHGHLFDHGRREAVLLKDFALQQGLTAEQIVVDPSSRNTYENALHSARILRERRTQSSLLVTSASHMRRALATFHKQGVHPDIYPVDFHGAHTITPLSFIPSESSLSITRAVIHELVGILTYRLLGYI